VLDRPLRAGKLFLHLFPSEISGFPPVGRSSAAPMGLVFLENTSSFSPLIGLPVISPLFFARVPRLCFFSAFFFCFTAFPPSTVLFGFSLHWAGVSPSLDWALVGRAAADDSLKKR